MINVDCVFGANASLSRGRLALASWGTTVNDCNPLSFAEGGEGKIGSGKARGAPWVDGKGGTMKKIPAMVD